MSILGIADCGLYIKASSEDGLKVLFKAKLKLFKFLEIKNEFDRDVTINIDFLDDNDREIYTFSTINVRSGELNFTYLEEIEISQNPDIVNVTKVKIEASLENTGTQMNPNSTEEFEFKSSVTAYIQTKL